MEKPNSCIPCQLYSISDGFIESEGSGTNGVGLLGEAGGYNEFIDGLPFRPYAQAGSKLEEVLRLASKDLGQPISRSQFILANVCNCHPPKDLLAGMSYEVDAIRNCEKNVDRAFEGKVKTVLGLGNIPLKSLTGVSGVVEEKQSVSHLRGYVFKSKYGWFVPTFHPSFVRRGNNHLTPLLVEDLKKALALAKGTFSSFSLHDSFRQPRYQIAPSLDEAWSFYYRVKDNPNCLLAYDIETDQTAIADEDERDELENTEITLIQFSLGKGEGIAFPWKDEYIKIAFMILALGNPKANHNTWNFDNPRLRAKGVEFGGMIHDTMWMFKHFQPKLPRGLQAVVSLAGFPFPWKHLYGKNLEWYGCADVDAVQWIVRWLPELMKARGVWEGYKRHVFGVYKVLDRASQTGIPVSEKKWDDLKGFFELERKKVDGEIQGIVPDECRNIKPRRKDKETGVVDYGYIREPKTVRFEFERYQKLSAEYAAQGKRVATFETYLYRKHNLAYCEFEVLDNGAREVINRWAVVEPFKASKDQLVRYLKWKRGEIDKKVEKLEEERKRDYGGRNPELTERIRELRELSEDYEIPTDLKSKKETTNKKELEEMYLKTGDPILEKVVKIRSLDTNLNNFLPNWKPRNGWVYPVYGFSPFQGQINSWSPNSQNVSKHTEYGNMFRGIVEAPTGYVFLEADKKSFHVGTLGYCANDPDYIRFSQIDPHSILGSYIDPSVLGGSISLKWSDNDIKLAAKEFKKRCKEWKEKDPQHHIDVRQELAKPTVLGNQLELGAKKLQRQNRRFIHYVTEREKRVKRGEGYSAEALQEVLKELFPKIPPFQREIKEKAFLEKFFVNEFGRIMYFYDVFNFSWDKKNSRWIKKDGDGARLPIAFRVQSTAFGMITEELLALEEMGVCEEHRFVVTIHDSLMFMPEVKKLDKCIEVINTVMNRPCKQLVNEATGKEGLKIGVEISVGRNWMKHDKEKNPEGMKEI